MRRGARAAFAITLGLAPFGLVVGVVADARGLSLLETLLMSGLVFAGTSQLVALELWSDPAPVLAHLGETESERAAGFDVLILADLLFKHPQHENMVKTIEMTLGRRRDAGGRRHDLDGRRGRGGGRDAAPGGHARDQHADD